MHGRVGGGGDLGTTSKNFDQSLKDQNGVPTEIWWLRDSPRAFILHREQIEEIPKQCQHLEHLMKI